jgi:TRAP-type uncharacterized transport system substrate-binding protein
MGLIQSGVNTTAEIWLFCLWWELHKFLLGFPSRLSERRRTKRGFIDEQRSSMVDLRPHDEQIFLAKNTHLDRGWRGDLCRSLRALSKLFKLTGPEEFPIATGRAGGAYDQYAQDYAQLLQQTEGVQLDIIETAGSVETLDKLIAREVPVGFVQSGTIGDRDTTGLYSLGSIFYEPILIFYRPDQFDEPLQYLYDLEGRKVGIGENGSGTNLMARLMLANNELDDRNTEFIELPTTDNYAALSAGEVDAAFFVMSPAAEIVIDMLNDPSLELMNLRRASAYEARYPYLTKFTISEGVVDLRNNIPNEDKTIVATTAMLAANELLHVDSARQLLTAGLLLHAGGGYFAEEGEFPSVDNSELTVPNNIQQFIELGPSDLEEYLPVSLASILQRLIFVVLPIVILLYPLLRSTPGAYGFANRYRVYRWYQQMRRIEIHLEESTVEELEEYLAELREMEQRLTDRLRVPLFYQRDFYNLRLHLRLVIERCERRQEELLASTDSIAESKNDAGASQTDTDPANADSEITEDKKHEKS